MNENRVTPALAASAGNGRRARAIATTVSVASAGTAAADGRVTCAKSKSVAASKQTPARLDHRIDVIPRNYLPRGPVVADLVAGMPNPYVPNT